MAHFYSTKRAHTNETLQRLIESLDIPRSYYEQAEERYKSFYRHLVRDGSKVQHMNPDVYLQGSFRLGTVIRPLLAKEIFDLDMVCELTALKDVYTQKQIKHLLGDEVKLYAEFNNFKEEAEEKPRCWRLNYADKVGFHMDILPAIPEAQDVVKILAEALERNGVNPQLAAKAIAITDIYDANYGTITTTWPYSNARGYAGWFESRVEVVAKSIRKSLVEMKKYASVEEVPAYELKTPLQRSIQILKRHRDWMFKDKPELKPISMIITTLAAHAYQGEEDLADALHGILERMPSFVNKTSPWVVNPTHPLEHYSEKWDSKPELQENFWAWHQSAVHYFEQIQLQEGSQLKGLVKKGFDIDLNENTNRSAGVAAAAAPAIYIPKPTRVDITRPTKPWGK